MKIFRPGYEYYGNGLGRTDGRDAGPNRLVGTVENDTLRGLGGADKLIGRGDSDPSAAAAET